jgi:glucose/arabinose dehydrogenase
MTRLARIVLAVPILSLFFLSSPSAFAAVKTELVAGGFRFPLYVTAPPGDDRLFIVEQRGMVWIHRGGATLPDPFLDIDSLVSAVSQFSERGLLGLAFDPDFDSNRFFFVCYTNNSGNSVLARYEVLAGNPDKADHSSAEIVLTQTQPFANHNGGMIEFGPDGYLYLGFGDGGSSGDPDENGQDLTTLLGKLLRIDVSSLPYTVPPDNPFVGVPGAEAPIWALGLRNPWRWSFDRQTGDLWIGDVGQGEWEEVDRQPASSGGGENYGWDQMEGFHCYEPPSNCGSDSLDLPIHEYPHGAECSITGGYVYRGAAAPELGGRYLFGDYCSGKVWSLTYDVAGDSVLQVTDLTSQLNPTGRINGLSSFGEDGFGEVFLVSRASADTGAVYRIVTDPTGVEGRESLPSTLRLGRPEPNPFAERTRFALAHDPSAAADVTVRVYDAAGRAIRTLASGVRSSGEIEWDGRSDGGDFIASGTYFIRLIDGAKSETRRVTFIR